MEGRVARISIAPVKALHLVNPDEVELTPVGVVGDRRFWLLDRDLRLVNGKRHPELMRVQPDWDEGSRRLALAFPDGSVVEGNVELGEQFEADLYGTPHPSRTVPGPWQEALSEFAGEPLTLLWSEGGAQDRGTDHGGWASLVSRGSLEGLRAEAGADEPVDGRRFRMLFEIDGVDAHEEDSWLGRQVAIGEAVIVPLGDVGRCVVTTCDPDSGVSDFDTLKLLAGYRREGVTEPLPFGVYCDVAVPGRVRVGDPVQLAVPDAVEA
jgi:MOSC domain-containing protein